MVAARPVDLRPAQVPHGVDLAAAWAWRFLVIAGAGYLILRVLDFFMVIVLPVAIALLITALVSPVVRWMKRTGLPAGIGAFLVRPGRAGLRRHPADPPRGGNAGQPNSGRRMGTPHTPW